MPRPTINVSGDAGGTGTGTAVTVTVGAGSNRVAYYFINNRDAGAGDVTGVSCTGGSMTQIGSTGTTANGKMRVFRYVNPGTGSFTVTPTISAAREHHGLLIVLNDVDQVTPNGTVSIATTTNVTDNQILLTFRGDEASATPAVPVYTPNGTATQTEYGDVRTSRVYVVGSLTPTTGTPVTGSFSFGGSTDGSQTYVMAVNVAVTAPTINTQPTAQTVVLAGPASNNPVTFSVSATTSGGALTYDWELESGVGTGVYANLADGNGATWTGQAAASCSATLTATTLSGRRVRCNVTDSNGTTTSTAVALTIYAGTTIAQPAATNGSGVATAVLTTDVVDSANGQLKLITFTKGSVTLRTTARKTS